MKRKLLYLLLIVSFFTVFCYIYSCNEQDTLFTFLTNHNLTNVTETIRRAQEVPPYDCCGNRSNWKDEFLRIPKRLHQTDKTDEIPEQYLPLILSWLQNHPDWEYYFWSDKDAECLINDLYPQYVDLYNKYKHKLQRSDAIRYFVLHRFGGVYADMDMRSLRPIEPFLSTNTCVLTPEPIVQTKLLFNQPSLITNCIMASTANHPFLTHVLEGLRTAYRDIKHVNDILYSTGPFFLNETYYNYLKKYSNSLNRVHPNVYIADFKHLVPRYDMWLKSTKYRRYCSSGKTTSSLHKEACDELVKTQFNYTVPQEAYTDHLWLHLGYVDSNKRKTHPIQTVAPRVKRYGSCNAG